MRHSITALARSLGLMAAAYAAGTLPAAVTAEPRQNTNSRGASDNGIVTSHRPANASAADRSATGPSQTAGIQGISRPNILFIVTDDQGPWTLGVAGAPNAYTPEIDRLARQGALFTNFFCVSAVCSPCRAALITGRYPSETGVEDVILENGKTGLDTSLATWPQLLQDAGYATALVGKWHLGHMKQEFLPTQRGYQRFSGYPVGGKTSRSPLIEIEGEWKTYDGQYTSDVLADLAMGYIQEFRGQPFAVSLHFWAPHANQGVPADFQLPYKDRTWLPLKEEDLSPWTARRLTIPNPDFPNLDVARVDRMSREYFASVHSVDRNIGRILRFLDDKGLSDNTVVILTSDNGYNLGHHGIWHKGNGWWITKDRKDPSGLYGTVRENLYDHSIRVPAVVRWPRRIRPGTVIHHATSHLDWFPTLLAMANVQTPEDARLRGHNILPLIEDPTQPWDDDVFAQYIGLRAYRTKEWKLVRDFKAGRNELYHLSEGVDERTNLVYSREAAAVQALANLDEKLRTKMIEINDPLLKVRPAAKPARGAAVQRSDKNLGTRN